MPLYIAKSGDLEGCYRCLTDRQTTLKDSATQLLIKYKSGALVTQCGNHMVNMMSKGGNCVVNKWLPNINNQSSSRQKMVPNWFENNQWSQGSPKLVIKLSVC